MSSNLVILGEAHFQKTSVSFIQDYITKNRPTALLHELVYDGQFTANEVKYALAKCDGSGICDPRTNMDIFQLCSKLRIPLIGCDLPEEAIAKLKPGPMRFEFEAREQKMLEVFQLYANSEENGNYIAVVGDAHLRERRCKFVNESPITVAIRNGSLKATVIRTMPRYMEFK